MSTPSSSGSSRSLGDMWDSLDSGQNTPTKTSRSGSTNSYTASTTPPTEEKTDAIDTISRESLRNPIGTTSKLSGRVKSNSPRESGKTSATLRISGFSIEHRLRKRTYKKTIEKEGQKTDKVLEETTKTAIKRYLADSTNFGARLFEDFQAIKNNELKNIFLEVIIDKLGGKETDVSLHKALERLGFIRGDLPIDSDFHVKIKDYAEKDADQILTRLSEYNFRETVREAGDATQLPKDSLALGDFMQNLCRLHQREGKLIEDAISETTLRLLNQINTDLLIESITDRGQDNPQFLVDIFDKVGLFAAKEKYFKKIKEKLNKQENKDTLIELNRKLEMKVNEHLLKTGNLNSLKKIKELETIDSQEKVEKLADFVEFLVNRDLIDDQLTKALTETPVAMPNNPPNDPRMHLLKTTLARTFDTLKGDSENELSTILRTSSKWPTAGLAKKWIAEPLISKFFPNISKLANDKEVDWEIPWEEIQENQIPIMTDHGIQEAEKLVLSLLELMKDISKTISKGENHEYKMLRELCESIKENVMEKFKNLQNIDLKTQAEKIGLDYFVLRVFNPIIIKEIAGLTKSKDKEKKEKLIMASRIIQKLFNKQRYDKGKMAVFNNFLDRVEAQGTIETVQKDLLGK